MNVRERVINKVISNVLNEAFGGFNKFQKYKKKAPADPNAPRKGKLQMEHPMVKKAKSSVTGEEKEYIAAYLTHVWADGAQKLADAINSSVPKHVMDAQVDGNKVLLRVNISAKNEIPTVINKMCAGIKQLNDYDEAHVEGICDRFFNFIDTVATGEDLENAKKRSISTWKEMLEKLNDPDVRKRLLKYQMSNDYARQYGNVLSPGNVKRVLDQFPSASFVVERSTWERVFNRTIMPNAQRIVVQKPLNSYPSRKELDMAAQKCGFANYLEAKSKTKNATQVMNKIKIEADRICTHFIPVVMYDVSQTIPPSDPTKDVWTNEIGLLDNISGALNQKAQEFDDTMGTSMKATADTNKDIINRTYENQWKYRRAQLQNFCAKKGIDLNVIQNEDDANFVAKATYLYAKSVMPSYGIIKEDEINKLAVMCAAAMCISCGIEPLPSDLSRKLGSQNTLTEGDAVVAHTVVDDLLPKLSVRAGNITSINTESLIRETSQEMQSDKPISINQFLAMCHGWYKNTEQTEENDGMVESYNSMRNIVKSIVTEEINKLSRR